MDLRNAYPTRADVAWDDIEGRIVIALPRSLNIMERAISRMFPIGNVRLVSLEGAAASCWRLADGTRSGAQIADALARDDHIPRAHARLARFCEDMAARGFLLVQRSPQPTPVEKRGLTRENGYQRLRCRRCGTLHPMPTTTGPRWFCPRCRRLNLEPQGP